MSKTHLYLDPGDAAWFQAKQQQAEDQHEYVMETFGMRVRRIRQTKSMSQADLASVASIGRNTVVAIERGTANPTHKLLQRIAMALDKRLELSLYDNDAPMYLVGRCPECGYFLDANWHAADCSLS